MSAPLFPNHALPLLQGWQAPGSLDLSAAFMRAGGWSLPRVEAFPDAAKLRERLEELRSHWRDNARMGLDLRGLRDGAEGVIAAAREAGVAFMLHTAELSMPVEPLQRSLIPRVVAVSCVEEARRAKAQGASALLVDAEQVAGMLNLGLPIIAATDTPDQARRALADGAIGIQPRSPLVLEDGSCQPFNARLMDGLDFAEERLFRRGPEPLPRLRIRNLDLDYPIQQGGMGVGVSWEGLAGAVARQGCVGLISAIGTGYHSSNREARLLGRPNQQGINPPDTLKAIVQEALRRAGGRGAVGVNILCAIEGYEASVRASVEAGAQIIVSGAGLPLALPGYVGDADVALVPIVSSGRALSVICKQWQRKFGRLPDAVVLEGPLSGGHQGLSVEQCDDPAHSLENLLPGVIEERDRWGDFPVLVAGGVWDRSDIDRMLALGASGVQMGTRFIGTFECDAHPVFKETILKAEAEDIVLMKSPVGMPARGVRTALQASIAAGTAPPVRCTSQCLQPCGHGKGAVAAGYCIADRLGDAFNGDAETGLFFSGSNGGRLKDLVSVRDLIEELTQDPGLQRMH